MPNYGDAKYWDDRYASDLGGPFDWLFEYKDVRAVMHQIVPKDADILMIGAGSANFSRDMYNDGYCTICNIDISSVVISQQKEANPEMQWMVMDAMNTSFEDESFPYIIDKSLIDTVLCYKNSEVCTFSLIQEMYRLLAPGGTYVTFSLHAEEEILDYFTFDEFQWAISTFKILNPRWTTEAQSCRRSVSHSMVICHKPRKDGSYSVPLPLSLTHVLSEEEYQELKDCADKIHFECALRDASTELLLSCLENALSGLCGANEKAQQVS